MIITITPKDLDTSVSDQGLTLDIAALAVGQITENGILEYNLDYTESGGDYAIEHYDYEKKFIDWLNSNYKNLSVKQQKLYKEAKTNLLPGAWLALHHDIAFVIGLQEFTAKLKEAAMEYWEVVPTDAAYELAQEVEKGVADSQEQLLHDWKYGDYHGNFDGVLPTVSKELTGERGNVEWYGWGNVKKPYQNSLEITATRQQMEEFLIDNWNLTEPIINEEKLPKYKDSTISRLYKQRVIEWLNYMAGKTIAKEQAENEKRRAEQLRVQEYQKQQAEVNKQRRIDELQAMTREVQS